MQATGGSTADALAAAFMQSVLPMALFDLGAAETIGRMIAVNAAFARLHERRPDELVGMRCEVLGPDHETWRATLQAARAKGSARCDSIRCRSRTGRWVEAELHIAALDGTDLAVAQLIDLTGRDRGNRALRESEKRLQDIVDNVPALVYVKDLEGRYIVMNRRCQEKFGIAPGMVDSQWAPASVARDYVVHDQEVLGLAQAREFHEEVHEDGTARTYISLKFPLFDHQGHAYAIGGVSTDITAVKQAERAASEARDLAEQANRAKSQFLSRMSHELRTPLNSILGYAQLVEMEDSDVPPPDAARRIIGAGEHLLSLINEVLEISRIEQGADRILLRHVHACDPLEEAIELVRPIADARGIRLEVDLHRGLYTFVNADPQRLKQVLLNVITNGVQYNSEDGEVRLGFELAGTDRLRYLVADTGEGIAAGAAERVFAPFDRLDRPDSGEQGAGLGLALSKALVETMGGEIGYEDRAEGGTTFFVEMPIAPAPPDAFDVVFKRDQQAGGTPQLVRPARVLYVEDNRENIEVVRRALGRLGPGLELQTAGSAALGLCLAREQEFDLVLLDLHLPDASGREVIHGLRRSDDRRGVPIIVLSADATQEQVNGALAAGAARYLTKPLNLRLLLEAVHEVLAP